MDQSRALAEYKEALLKRGLSPRHREAMRLVASGMPIVKVAKQLGYSAGRLWQVAASPLWKREMAKLMTQLDRNAFDAMQALRDLQPKAIDTFSQLMDLEDYPSTRLTVAKDILDRTGVKVPTETHTVEGTKSYEEQLAQVTVKYEKSGPEKNYIQVLDGEELLADSKEDDE